MVLVVFLLLALSAGAGARAATSSVWDSVPDSAAARPDTLSFSGVLTRIKLGSPALRAIPYRVTAATALVDQAGAWPNPALLAEAENVNGGYSGLDQSEFSLWLAQEFELGGKRAKRVDQAASAVDEAALEASSESFAVYLDAKARYAAVVHAEERIRLAVEAEALVAHLARAAGDRVRAGAALTADAALADAALARTRLAIDTARAERTSARVALSALWGQSTGFDEPVTSELPFVRSVLPTDSTQAWAARSPSVARLRIASAARRADAALERSLRVPNFTLAAGARRVEADDASTLLFAVGLPLPVWDRRSAATRAAEARGRAAEIEVDAARASVASALVARITTLAVLQDRLHKTQDIVAPALATALDNMRTAYAIGRVSYSDLLEAQRALIALYNDANDARLAIVDETIAIERLTGRTLEELMGNE
ncbi:MAG TPA: TolC family protein [Candidatus Krumholzibacteria bacterium]|nr:TolC family protein [Candidatus Krumholzibacteria bacterium]